MRYLRSAALALVLIGPLRAEPREPHAIAFVERWLADPAAAGSFAGVFPRFRFTAELAAAVAGRDTALSEALLPLLRDASDAEIALLRMERGAAERRADAAANLAATLDDIGRNLSGRRAAGLPDRIERDAVAGAALRFHATAAEARAILPGIARRLDALGAPDPSPLPLSTPPIPSRTDPAALAAGSPVLTALRMLAERRTAALSGDPHTAPPLEPVLAPDRGLPAPAIARIGALDPLSAGAAETLAGDARAALEEAIALRLDAIAALRAAEFSEERARAMADTAALAERQFQRGAIRFDLFLASQEAWLDTLRARDDHLLALWRESLELRGLAGESALPTPAE